MYKQGLVTSRAMTTIEMTSVYSPVATRPSASQSGNNLVQSTDNADEIDDILRQGEWISEAIPPSATGYAMLVIAGVQFVLGCVLLFAGIVSAESNAEWILVDTASGDAVVVMVMVHIWFTAGPTAKALYQSYEITFLDGREKGTGKAYQLIPLIAAIGMLAIVHTSWGLMALPPSVIAGGEREHRTLFRAASATCLSVVTMWAAGGVFTVAKTSARMTIHHRVRLLVRACMPVLACVLFIWFDRMPRNSKDETPSVAIVLMAGMVGCVVAVVEGYIVSRRWQEGHGHGNHTNSMDAMRAIVQGVSWGILFIFLATWIDVYMADYDTAVATCSGIGLPSRLRFGDGPKDVEQLQTCATRCDRSEQPRCGASHTTGCCAHVTSVFSFGEHRVVREQSVLCLVLYLMVGGCAGIMLEGWGVYTGNMSGYRKKGDDL